MTLLALRGDEHLLDVGCGRGVVLMLAAERLPVGRAVGLDLWLTTDQSGNSEQATWRNADLEGIGARIELHTGDMRRLPFPDASFDVVTSSLAPLITLGMRKAVSRPFRRCCVSCGGAEQ